MRYETYDNTGKLISSRDEPPSQQEINAGTLRDYARASIQTFEAADRDWATLTAAQRNDVMKQVVRTVARLARIVNDQLDAT